MELSDGEIMYYYVEDGKEFIQSDNRHFPELRNAQSQPIGKILNEIINIDFDELCKNIDISTHNNLKVPTGKYGTYRRNYKIQNINNITPETNAVVNVLFVLNFRYSKFDKSDDTYYQSNLIKSLIDEIKDIVQREDFNELSLDFISYYLGINNIEIQNKVPEKYAHAAFAPILAKYLDNDYYEIEKALDCIFIKFYRSNLNEKEILVNEILKQLKYRGITTIDYEIFRKVISKCSLLSKPPEIIDCANLYELDAEELFEYQKLCYEYNQGRTFKLLNLLQFIKLSFVNCCEYNITPRICKQCGNLFFSKSNKLYCSDSCLKKAKKEQEKARVYSLRLPNGEVIALNYNTVLKNYENKIKRLTEHIQNESLTKESKKIIINKLKLLQNKYSILRIELEEKMKKAENPKEKNKIESCLANLFYNLSNFYNKRNSLLNTYQNAVDTESDIHIKIPEVDCDYNVSIIDFIIPKPEFK